MTSAEICGNQKHAGEVCQDEVDNFDWETHLPVLYYFGLTKINYSLETCVGDVVQNCLIRGGLHQRIKNDSEVWCTCTWDKNLHL